MKHLGHENKGNDQRKVGSGGPGSSPGWGYCVVFLGKTLYSHSASLHPGVQMGTSKYAGGNPTMD